MANILREAYDGLPEPQQHLLKSAVASSACAASVVMGGFAMRNRDWTSERPMESTLLEDVRFIRSVFYPIGAVVYAITASQEFEAFRNARSAEQV